MANGITANLKTSIASKLETRSGLDADLATVGEGIVSHLSQVLQHKVGVANLRGNLVADSDMSNFDKFVPAAITAIQKGTHVLLPANEIDDLSGWAVPLRHQDRLFGALIIRNNPAPDDSIVMVAKSLSELLLYQMLVMDKVAQENRVLDKFFYDLFEHEEPSEKLVQDSLFFNSQFFQIDFSEPKIAAVLTLQDFSKDVLTSQPILPADEHRLTAIKDSIKEALAEHLDLKDSIIAYMGLDDFTLLLPHRPTVEKEGKKKDHKAKHPYLYSHEQFNQLTAALETKFNRRVWLGLGQYTPDLPGLIKSYHGAKQTVRLGTKLSPKNSVFYYTEMLLPIMLQQADPLLQKQFVENELGELINERDLIITLLTHFDCNLNLKKTAYELKIHKNTLYYRLAKVKKILEVDPQEFGEAIKLKAALYLWQINQEKTAD